MSDLPLGNLWNILRQIDIGEIHVEADRVVNIVVAGPPDSPVERLAEILRSDEAATDEWPASVVRTVSPPSDDWAVTGTDLIIAVDTDPQGFVLDQNSIPVIDVHTSASPDVEVPTDSRIYLPVVDREHVADVLAPMIVEQLGDAALGAARRLPILRRAYGDWLLNETSRANAIYAFSTGIAETVPALNIPLNVADVVLLTKNQLIMVYRLALAAGRPMSLFGVLGELLGVIGAGFLWRQIARELVGLIPVVGIIPKAAVAYGGTYAIGQAAQTYLIEGEVPGREQIKSLYEQAVARGRILAQSLARRRERNTNLLNS